MKLQDFFKTVTLPIGNVLVQKFDERHHGKYLLKFSAVTDDQERIEQTVSYSSKSTRDCDYAYPEKHIEMMLQFLPDFRMKAKKSESEKSNSTPKI